MVQFFKGDSSKNLLIYILLIFSSFFTLNAHAGGSVPVFAKQFIPATIGPGSVSTQTLTIDNTNNPSPITGLSFTDTLPADVLIATPANASTNCAEATLTAPDGGSTITFSDGKVGSSASCVVDVDVTSNTVGIHTNPSITLNTNSGSASSAPVDLTVVSTLPGFSKSFAPASVPLGGRSTLTFIIDNTSNASRVGNLDFTDNLPTGMVVADPANIATDCISASAPNTSVTANPGSNIIILDANGNTIFPGFEVLQSGASCTVTVDVTTTGSGILNNISGDLLSDFTSAGKATSTLTVTTTPLFIQKSFTNDPVAPGGTVTLDFTLTNFDRSNIATSVAFTDDLTTALSGLTFDSVLSNDCGGTITGVASTTIDFSGGTLAVSGSCTISTSLSVPTAATPSVYTNVTSAITGTVGGNFVTGNIATEILFVAPSPELTMEFLEVGTLASDPLVDAGDQVVLRYTISNPSTTSAASDIEFLDELTDGSGGSPPDLTSGFLPFPLNVILPTVPDPACGAGSSVSLSFIDTDRQGFKLTGGNIAAGASCTFDVTLTIPVDVAPGSYTNTTEEPTATIDSATRTGKVASDTLTIIAAPSLSKAFIDAPVAPGETVTLEFTLSHPADAGGDATDISFTDDLTALAPAIAGLTATGLPITGACDADGIGENLGTGTLSGSMGDTLLTLTGASLSPGQSCTISVTLNVPTDATAGSFTNTTSGVMAMVGGLITTSAPASDDLDISGLKFSKEFLNNPVLPGATTTLRFSIENLHPTDNATITFFSDNLGSGSNGALSGLAATGGPTIDTCLGSLSGTSSLTYTGGSVLGGETCIIEVPVLVPTGAANGDYNNVTSSLIATQGGNTVSVSPATDTLTVNDNLIQLTKSFIDDPVAPGNPVTLEFTLTNLDSVNPASAIAFSDDLAATLAGLTFDSVLLNDCGATVLGASTSSITVTDGSLAAAASCNIRTSLSVPAAALAASYTNTTSSVTATIDGFTVTGDAASDNLDISNLLQFSKSFDGPSTATGTAILTFTISNPGTSAATGIAFTDDLDSVISGLVASSLPAMPCGAGSSVTGSSLITLSAGVLPPMGGMCSFDVEVTIPAIEAIGSFTNTTSDLLLNGLFVSPPATADLIIEPAPVFSKSFTPTTVAVNGPNTLSRLTFTIDNTASTLNVTELAFTDNLPAGLEIANPPNPTTTCGGTVLPTTPTSGVYSGGTVAAGSSCNIEIDVINTSSGDKVNTTEFLTSSSGNSGFATATLLVDESPVITAPADIPAFEAQGVNSTVSLGAPVITDFVDGSGLIATPNPDGSSLSLGTTPIIWTVTDSLGNASTATQSVTIVDTTAPFLSPSPNITQEATANLTPVSLDSATVTDAVSSGLVATITINPGPFPVGMTTVTWSATDTASPANTGTATQIVTITDTTPPVITLNGASTVSLDFGVPFIDDGATATDLVDGDLGSISPSGTVGTAPGTYTLTYAVTDNASNPASVTRTVIIGAVRSFSSLLPSGLLGSLSFTSTDAGCTFNTSSLAYIDITGATITPPVTLSFVDGLITFEIVNCTAGATVDITMDYGQPLPPNASYWKEGTPYFQIPSTINGNTVSFTLTDGQLGDTDETEDGTITDPGGLALFSATGIPTLSNWALILLIMLLLSSMIFYRRRSMYQQN